MPRIKHINEIANPFDPAEEGNYTLRIIEAEDTKSKAGAEMLRVKMEIIAAEDKENEAHIGKKITDYRVWGGDDPSNFALFGIRQYAVAAGVDPANFSAGELVGTELDAYVRIREGNEEYPNPSNNIGQILVDVE